MYDSYLDVRLFGHEGKQTITISTYFRLLNSASQRAYDDLTRGELPAIFPQFFGGIRGSTVTIAAHSFGVLELITKRGNGVGVDSDMLLSPPLATTKCSDSMGLISTVNTNQIFLELFHGIVSICTGAWYAFIRYAKPFVMKAMVGCVVAPLPQ